MSIINSVHSGCFAYIEWEDLLSKPHVQSLLDLAVDEDIGNGDVTTAAIFPEARSATAHVISRVEGVVCGVPLATKLLRRFDPTAEINGSPCGTRLCAGDVVMQMRADVRALLTAERCMLNFLMHLSGVASATRILVDMIPKECAAKIYDTRKTTPGWRLLEKAAVRAGGGENHRMGLFDAVLIKDNHIAAAGSVCEALHRVALHARPGIVVQVEVDTCAQLREALDAGATLILLDNFTDEQLREAVSMTAGRAVLEASGGLQASRIADVARTGVDRISVGAITHSAKPLDLSMEFLS